MFYVYYGLYVLLGLIGCVFLGLLSHLDENKHYYKYKNHKEFKPFKLLRRDCLLILIGSGLAGPLVFVVCFGAFMIQWITEDWTGFWSKPVCNCFEPKKEGK